MIINSAPAKICFRTPRPKLGQCYIGDRLQITPLPSVPSLIKHFLFTPASWSHVTKLPWARPLPGGCWTAQKW